MVTETTYQDIKEILSDPDQPRVKIPYYIIDSEEGNVTVLSAGRNGEEYNKTFGLIHTYPGVINLTCLYGQGLLLIQRFNEEGDGAREVKLYSLRPGKNIEIPSGYAHVIINTGKQYLITLDNLLKNNRFINRGPLIGNHGLAYYVIEKKGEISLEKNPNYKYPPEIFMEG